jgi:hypothetical protein
MVRISTTPVVLATLLATLLGAAPAGRAAAPGLENYLDGLLGGLIRTHHIPGAVVVIVRDGAVVLARG